MWEIIKVRIAWEIGAMLTGIAWCVSIIFICVAGSLLIWFIKQHIFGWEWVTDPAPGKIGKILVSPSSQLHSKNKR